jgi:hypothetical protein
VTTTSWANWSVQDSQLPDKIRVSESLDLYASF